MCQCGAHGQYVTVRPKLGVLYLVPDSPEWFDWLASLTSFRDVGTRGALFGVPCFQERATHAQLGGPTPNTFQIGTSGVAWANSLEP